MYKPNCVASPEDISKYVDEIQTFLEAHYEADNGDQCVERLTQLEGYLALTGKMLADAKHHHRSLQESSIVEAVKKAQQSKMSPSTLNKYIESVCRDYAYLVDRCDRLNSGCVHSIDSVRTIVSKLKQEAMLAGYGNRY